MPRRSPASLPESAPARRCAAGVARFWCLAAGWLAACGALGCSEAPGGGVFVRLENASRFDFERVTVAWEGDLPPPSALPAGARSDYMNPDEAYRYAYIEAEAADAAFVHIIFDFTGESPLEDGYYTYVLSAELLEPPSFTNTDPPKRLGGLEIELRPEPSPR